MTFTLFSASLLYLSAYGIFYYHEKILTVLTSFYKLFNKIYI